MNVAVPKRYDNTLATVPTETLPTGWAAAAKVVRRGCGQRKVLGERLLRLMWESGFQGVPALEFYGTSLLWYLAGSEEVPYAGGKLKTHEAEAIRVRAREVSIAELRDVEPYGAPLSCERLDLDPYDHRPIGA